jgi:hypothetical protein
MMLLGDQGREDGARRAAPGSHERARSIEMDDQRTAAALQRSSERWLAWLRRRLVAQRKPAGPPLLALWDLLEEWFSSDEFHHASALAAAIAGAGDGRGDATLAALAAHRLALRQLLEDLAEAGGSADPARLAGQVHILVEGAVVGALVDRQPTVARHARELTQIALAGRAGG